MIREKSLKELGNQQAILRFEIAIRLLSNEISPEQAKSRINRIYQAYSNSLKQQFAKNRSMSGKRFNGKAINNRKSVQNMVQ